MPAYEFRCNACRRKVTVTTKTYREYNVRSPPHPRSRGLYCPEWIFVSINLSIDLIRTPSTFCSSRLRGHFTGCVIKSE